MNTTFFINGGAGRVICSIPALEKYAKLNPEDDFKVLLGGWENLFWSHPLLQNKSFFATQKGAFENYMKNNKIVYPEPYFVHGYYNQKLSMSEAFDEIINNTQDHSDLNSPKLYVSTFEKVNIRRILKEVKEKKKKNKVLVIQPYGSGMSILDNRPHDKSNRSLDVDDYLKLVKKINEKDKSILIVFFGDKKFKHPNDFITEYCSEVDTDLRFYLSLISECDYFVGCDSVGQHMTRALNKKGLVIMGATHETNVSYPNHFQFYRNGKIPVYEPIRLSDIDCEFAGRLNDGVMTFDDLQLDQICDIILKNIYNG
jgi:hypothetical protein